MRTSVIDLNARTFASDITPRDRLAGRRNSDFNPSALCHIVFRSDAVIDPYGVNLALASALNVRIALRLRCPAFALIIAVLNHHVIRSFIHRDFDAMRLPVIATFESLCRHVLELCARNGPVCICRARVIAHALNTD